MKKSPPQSVQAKLFQWVVIALGVVVWLYNLLRMKNLDQSSLSAVVLFGLANILISFKPVTITTPGMKMGNQKHISISLSDTLTFLVMILYGPEPAIVLSGLDGLIASGRTVKRWQSNVFTLAMIALSIWAAVRTYEIMMQFQGRAPYDGLNQSPLSLILPLFVTATVHFVVNSLLCAMLIALRYHRSLWQQLVDNHLWIGITYFPLAALSVLLYTSIQRFGWVSVIAMIPVLLVIYFSYKQYNQKVEEKLRKIDEINGLHLATARSLALAIDARSGTSAGHAERVKIYVRGLARLMNLSEMETQALEAGAMLRDVGMLAVPDHILTKPSQLTPAEFERMKMHTVVGAEILGQVNFPYPIVPIIRHHHERWDGLGYPDKLKGEEIPLTARILSIADCFDAARENRNYRQAMSLENAVLWLRENAGKAFDPDLVKLFIENLPQFEAEVAAWAQNQLASLQPLSAQTHSSGNSSTPDQASAAAYTHSLEQISGAHREVVMLYELAQTIGRSLSLRETLAVLLKQASELVPSTTSAVLLREKDVEVLKFSYVLGKNSDAFRDCNVEIGKGNIGAVFTSQAPLVNINPLADLKELGFLSEIDYQTSLIVPLSKGDSILGVFVLYSSELSEYSSEHIRLVEAIARLAGDAIANALFHEETKETAYTDRLTGLPNMRAILRAFDAEVDRARRTGQSFTFLMMDLDGFKMINDTLGHQMGDAFLIEISKRIKSHMRSTDLFGRYAGDEFVAIMPNTRIKDISEVVERIKHTVDNCILHTEDGRAAKGGVSIGMSECDGYTSTLEELMSKADAAMYADKAERKRRKALLNNTESTVRSQTAA